MPRALFGRLYLVTSAIRLGLTSADRCLNAAGVTNSRLQALAAAPNPEPPSSDVEDPTDEEEEEDAPAPAPASAPAMAAAETEVDVFIDDGGLEELALASNLQVRAPVSALCCCVVVLCGILAGLARTPSCADNRSPFPLASLAWILPPCRLRRAHPSSQHFIIIFRRPLWFFFLCFFFGCAQPH